ncbi:MAG TPA: hypothetical protein VJH65_00160 [Candidatus Nanoarchaeia archaeon]|nr:hypothetical protein [Candidatus Nanoarchaeia archaeon]
MRELDKVLDKNEKVFWEGKPKFWPFLLGGSIITTIFGLFWMVFLIPFIVIAAINIAQGVFLVGEYSYCHISGWELY